MHLQPMLAAEARALLQRLGWTQAVAAARLGVTTRRMKMYLACDGCIPGGRADHLRMIAEKEGLREDSG